MAIARRPKTNENTATAVDVNALIAKGGTVASGAKSTEEKESGAFTLRIPTNLLRSLDDHLKQRPLKTTRQYWILEAIVEKLQKEGRQISD